MKLLVVLPLSRAKIGPNHDRSGSIAADSDYWSRTGVESKRLFRSTPGEAHATVVTDDGNIGVGVCDNDEMHRSLVQYVS